MYKNSLERALNGILKGITTLTSDLNFVSCECSPSDSSSRNLGKRLHGVLCRVKLPEMVLLAKRATIEWSLSAMWNRVALNVITTDSRFYHAAAAESLFLPPTHQNSAAAAETDAKELFEEGMMGG
ncbi:hypothetical protein DMENIID0001_058820 [Sergentomyia squamirostris]